MPVPTTIDDLSTTASSNSPAGSETPTEGDNYIRTLSAFIASLRDKLNGTSATGTVNGATFTGTHTFSSGNLLHGTYTPTISNTSNVSSSSVTTAWQYTRIGDVVTMGGQVSITPTAAGAVSLNISLPIASNFAAAGNLAGSAQNSTTSTIYPYITGDSLNDKASLLFTAPGTAAIVFSIFAIYRVI